MNKSQYESLSKEQLIDKILKLEKERYGLVWEDKEENVAKRCESELPLLQEDCSREIVCDPSLPYNIIIEGDNYHSLYALSFTHKKSIDVIYIDPPYNTGNKDFVYNDSYVDKEDTYRHSKWLSFMSKRLRLAKTLLKNSGVIFISINEEEFAQLKLLCDSIFGESNYLTTFTIKVRHEDRILKGDKDYHEVVEYLLLYRKSKDFKTIKRQKDNTSIDEYIYSVIEKTKEPQEQIIGGKKVWIFHPCEYQITKHKTPSSNRLKKINIRGSIKEGNSSGRFFMKFLSEKIGNTTEMGNLYKVENIGDDSLDYRYFLIPDKKSRVNGDYFQGIPIDKKDVKEIPYPNYFDFVEDFNKVGSEGGVEFRNGKKPINFIKKVLELSGCTSGIVLDFFAGSASTGHAVLEMNKEDGGQRKFILCTNNENNICTEVTYPRIEKVIKGYSNVQGIPANLKYYTQTFVPVILSDSDKRELVNRSTEILCVAEDCFEEVRRRNKGTFDFSIYKNAEKQMAIIYDEDSIGDCVNYLNKNKVKQKTIIYVFSYDHTYDTEDFVDLNIDFSVKPIPEAIINVYRKISKMKKK